MANGVCRTAVASTRGVGCEISPALTGSRGELGRGSEAAGRCPVGVEAAEPFGTDDLSLASRLYQLAKLYREQGEDGQAEPLLERALIIEETALGLEHPRVAITLTDLMYLYRRQGRETAAVAAAARATHILAEHARAGRVM